MLRISRMHGSPLSTAGQTSLPHNAPDSFVVDLPALSNQRFGHATIAIADKGFTDFLDSVTKLLITFLVS